MIDVTSLCLHVSWFRTSIDKVLKSTTQLLLCIRSPACIVSWLQIWDAEIEILLIIALIMSSMLNQGTAREGRILRRLHRERLHAWLVTSRSTKVIHTVLLLYHVRRSRKPVRGVSRSKDIRLEICRSLHIYKRICFELSTFFGQPEDV